MKTLEMLDTIVQMDALDYLRGLDDNSINCVVTSPPYFGLRDYGHDNQIGLENTPSAYIQRLMEVFCEVQRVLTLDGTVWVNLGDSYANDDKWGGRTGGKHVKDLHGDTGIGRERKSTGLAPKNLMGIPWRFAFAMQDAGWTLRSDIIWEKPNAMPASVKDRPTMSHEYVFLFSKSRKYYYDYKEASEPALTTDRNPPRGSVGVGKKLNAGRRKQDETGNGQYTDFNARYNAKIDEDKQLMMRNLRSVWSISTSPARDVKHFATMPKALVSRCIKIGCPEGGIVLDPFMGSGTTALVARNTGRHFVGCDLFVDYVAIANRRLAELYTAQMFTDEPTSTDEVAITGDVFAIEEFPSTRVDESE